MNIDSLTSQWREGGVALGDTLLLHSSLKRTLLQAKSSQSTITVETVLESFLRAVGPEGTLLLPLFNFDFTSGSPFSHHSTPSKMGALTELARKRPDAVRTGHPIYSFAVIGAQSHRFANVNNQSGYGVDSPFALLRELDGKVGILNLDDQNSMTFYHHVEEMLNVDYRYHKTFVGDYTDAQGNQAKRSYSLFVRDTEKGVQTHVNPMGEELWRKGLYQGSRHDEGSGFRTIRARDLFDTTAAVIQNGKALGTLYRVDLGSV